MTGASRARPGDRQEGGANEQGEGRYCVDKLHATQVRVRGGIGPGRAGWGWWTECSTRRVLTEVVEDGWECGEVWLLMAGVLVCDADCVRES